MSKEKSVASPSIWQELLFETGLYKRSQGRIARQVTFAALAIAVAVGCWQLRTWLGGFDGMGVVDWAVPLGLALVGVWLSYRVVNLPRFADFLIAVEAEMNKVAWPTRGELIRSSVVVILLIFFLALAMLAYDSFWIALFQAIGVLRTGDGS